MPIAGDRRKLNMLVERKLDETEMMIFPANRAGRFCNGRKRQRAAVKAIPSGDAVAPYFSVRN